MLQNIVRGFCRHSRGVILVAGTAGVLAGVQRLLSQPKSARPRTSDRFSVRRTQSDLGYTYWVVQGHGKYRGFALFDTWPEAIAEVLRRTSRRAVRQPVTAEHVAV